MPPGPCEELLNPATPKHRSALFYRAGGQLSRRRTASLDQRAIPAGDPLQRYPVCRFNSSHIHREQDGCADGRSIFERNSHRASQKPTAPVFLPARVHGRTGDEHGGFCRPVRAATVVLKSAASFRLPSRKFERQRISGPAFGCPRVPGRYARRRCSGLVGKGSAGPGFAVPAIGNTLLLHARRWEPEHRQRVQAGLHAWRQSRAGERSA